MNEMTKEFKTWFRNQHECLNPKQAWIAWQAAINHTQKVSRKYAEKSKCMCGDEIADELNG